MAEDPDAADRAARPVLQVIRGDASPEEVAALLAVIAARSSGVVEDEPAPTRGGWSDRRHVMPPMPAAGPGAWRSAGWAR